jgi:hypothetical protein
MTTRMDVLESANQNQQYKNLHKFNCGEIDEKEFIKRQEKRSLKYQELINALTKDIDSENKKY